MNTTVATVVSTKMYTLNATYSTPRARLTGMKTRHLTRSITILVLCIISTFLNLFAAMIIAFVGKLRKRRSNKFLLNLLISDVCASLAILIMVSCSLEITQDDMNFKDFVEKQLPLLIVICGFNLLSIANLISLTLDRLFAVKYPFIYQTSIKTKHVYIIISSAWILSLIYLIFLLVAWQQLEMSAIKQISSLSFLIVVLSGFVTLVLSNILIYFEAKKQLREISKTYVDNVNRKMSTKSLLQRRELRLIQINVGMVASFVLFLLPLLITKMYSYVNNKFISLDFELAAWYLVCFKYIFDPIIYIALSHDVKEEIRRMYTPLLESFSSRKTSSITVDTNM